MPNFRFTRICRKIVDVAIYALYLESFCGVNLAIRKVFAFSDSGSTWVYLGRPGSIRSTWVNLGQLGFTWVYLGLLGSIWVY